MSRISFEDVRPVAPVDLRRADVACFVGLAGLAGLVIPDDVRPWLRSLGLLRYPFALAPGTVVPPLPASVRTWFLSQSWIRRDVSAAAAAAGLGSGSLGALSAPLAANDPVATLIAPLAADAPLFVRLAGEIVAVAAVDAGRTRLTLGRGLAGSVAAAHAAGDPVVAVGLDPFAPLAARLAASLPAAVRDGLQARGWLTGRTARDLDRLYDVPIALESYAAFGALFDDGAAGTIPGNSYLAAAVRSFFAQGGARCYVVRMGDPVVAPLPPGQATRLLAALLPGDARDPADASTWHGTGHLGALPDVSFLCLPDLPVLTASAPPAIAESVPAALSGPVQFAECAQQTLPVPDVRTNPAAAPRLGPADYATWAGAVGRIVQFLASGTQRGEASLREIQLVAALPLPQDAAIAAAPAQDAGAALARDVHDELATYLPEMPEPFAAIAAPNLSSAFLQLAYPWLVTSGSGALPDALEPPDGALAGMLARNAMTNGTYASATKLAPAGISDLWPALPAEDTNVSEGPLVWGSGVPKALIERISLFGFTPAGIALLSDVTAYPGEAYRDASVNRLVAVICRSARRFGEAVVFAQNGPALWSRVQGFLQNLMTRLWTANAFDGATVRDAFSVRCDRTTMTQNDLDNGRLVAGVSFAAAAKVRHVRITLGFEAGAASPADVAAALAGGI